MFSERNSKNEYKKAIIFVAIFTLISMVALSIIVLLIQNKGEVDYFNAIINMSCIALLIEDIFTFIISFILEKKKKISQIPTWEKVIYILSIFWAFFFCC
ncbi:hypothetical protein NWP96_04915 [Mycoplasmopsis cynos]|nr:hypothetical protein [Mycoplasmopsis cynos]